MLHEYVKEGHKSGSTFDEHGNTNVHAPKQNVKMSYNLKKDANNVSLTKEV